MRYHDSSLAFMVFLCRHDLSLGEFELVMRYGQMLLFQFAASSGLSPQANNTIVAKSWENIERLKQLNPTTPWTCFAASKYCCTVRRNPGQAMEVILPHMHKKPGHLAALTKLGAFWTRCRCMGFVHGRTECS